MSELYECNNTGNFDYQEEGILVAELIYDTRQAMVEIPVVDKWKIVTDAAEVKTTIRAVSGALLSLCMVHPEKTPSMFLYPSGTCICYGCQFKGDAADLSVNQIYKPIDEFFANTGLDVPIPLVNQIAGCRLQRKMYHAELFSNTDPNQELF